MEYRKNIRAQRTRERLRTAAHRLFLKQGYQATSIDAILVEAGISSKETLYRYYSSKEALFIDVLSHLTMEQPGFSEKLAALPTPNDLQSLRQALLQLSREILLDDVPARLSPPGSYDHRRSATLSATRYPVFLDCYATWSCHHHLAATSSQRATGHRRH